MSSMWPTPSYRFVLTYMQDEKTQNNYRSNVYRGLRDLEKFLPNISGGAELFAMYEDMTKKELGSTQSLLDEFSAALLQIIPALGEIPVLQLVDLASIAADVGAAREATEAAGEDGDEYAEVVAGAVSYTHLTLPTKRIV